MMKFNTKSIKKKSKSRKIEIKSLLIVLVAVFASISPFVHIALPKTSNEVLEIEYKLKENKITQSEYDIQLSSIKDSEKCFGFTNKRKFWYAVGKPIAMLLFSFILFYLITYIEKEEIKNAARISALLFSTISSYFVIWTFWHRQDFPITAYFVVIGISSILSTSLSYKLITNHKDLLLKAELMKRHIRELIGFAIHETKEESKDKMWNVFKGIRDAEQGR